MPLARFEGIEKNGRFYLFSCRVPSGRFTIFAEFHGTAPSACTVFLRDVATSRHSPNKFGSALDFRNVIESVPLEANKRSPLQ